MVRHPGTALVMALGGLVLASVAATSSASPTTLPSNGGFDTGTQGWTAAGFATIAWSPVDAVADPNSGSAVVTAISLSASRSGSGAYQCVPVEAGTMYWLSALAHAPTAQSRTAFPGFRVAFYSSATCLSETLGLSVVNWPKAAQGHWESVGVRVTAPEAAKFAWVGIMTWAEAVPATGTPGTTAVLNWDAVVLSPLGYLRTVPAVAADH